MPSTTRVERDSSRGRPYARALAKALTLGGAEPERNRSVALVNPPESSA